MTYKKIGDLRRSQLITTFGIGSIVDLRDYSVMISGQQDWDENKLITLREERLEKKLNIECLMLPEAAKENKDYSVPCIRFPEWVFCPKCKRLAHINSFGGPYENKCIRCSKPRSPQPLVPTRFVVSCEKGHIDNFPWEWWVHKGATCERPDLTISATGRSTSLASVTIYCKKCGAYRSLAGIFSPNALVDLNCSGRRPWLGDSIACDEKPVVLQRSSASVYFPVHESAISIPPFSSQINKIFHSPDVEVILETLEDNKEALRNALKAYIERRKLSFDIDTVMKAYKFRREFKKSDNIRDLRFEEYMVLCNPAERDPESDFYALKAEVPSGFNKFISRIIMIHRLREVRALCGFKRIQAESSHVSKMSSEPKRWLPGLEVNGEGIFVELDKNMLKKWIEVGGKELERRASQIEAVRKRLHTEGKWTVIENRITPELLLIHTLAHLMIQQLTIECGYSSASLRERLYVGEGPEKTQKMNGFLIYTATADSEGSLGGLVRQARTERFDGLLSRTLDQAKWCSNDPLCIESTGQGIYSLNLAACHTCSLLPETSCEIINKNCYLDRGVVVGIPDNPKVGYFSTLFK